MVVAIRPANSREKADEDKDNMQMEANTRLMNLFAFIQNASECELPHIHNYARAEEIVSSVA